jgi:hypothetical protein
MRRLPNPRLISVVVVCSVSALQGRRFTDFDRSERLTRYRVCEAQDASSRAGRSSEIADVDIIVAVQSHAGGHVQSAHDFLSDAFCDSDDPALANVWKTRRTGEFHNIQPSLAILLNVNNGGEPSPVIDHETLVRHLWSFDDPTSTGNMVRVDVDLGVDTGEIVEQSVKPQFISGTSASLSLYIYAAGV